ncbi:MAG: UDP-N-acetylmuramate dehydrogenase [Gammaproteobacteria bacterium]|nr:UDP-N-acetylmuramate dehydrogenase [Gammaproteobacteria bacterium]
MPTIENNVPLRDHHTFATDAKARYAANVVHIKDLTALRETPMWHDNPLLILGAGSNTLFQRDFSGLILFNGIQGIELAKESSDHIWLKVGAGENWHELVQFCIAQEYAGIENLSLIPGTVGAAPIQNIGAYGVEFESVFVELTAFDLKSGKTTRFDHSDCAFGYRFSLFKTECANQFYITDVTLRLNKKPQFHLDYGQIRDVLNEMGVTTPSIKTISEAVIKIRRSKLPDPSQLPNAGSFFKNPIITQELFESLLNKHPDIKYYPEKNNMKKIPAAWLIEQCGWRGKRSGRVGVHENQALVIINYDHGSGDDICNLAKAIQADVKNKFSIELTPEVCIL